MKLFVIFLTLLLIAIAPVQSISPDYIKMVQNADSHLIAYYKFNGNLKDEKGLSNGVFATGNIKPNTIENFINGFDDASNGAILFGSKADAWKRVDLGTFSPVKMGTEGEMTVAFWTYWNGSTGSWQDIISKRDTWAVNGMEWGINHHFLKTGDFLSVRRNSLNADSALTFPVGKWVHVAIAADGKNVNFYINGVLGDTKPFTYGTKNDAMIHVGTSPNGLVDSYNGALDEIRFYSRLLTEDEIWALYLVDTKQEKAPPARPSTPKPAPTATPTAAPTAAPAAIPLRESGLDAFPGAEGYGKKAVGGRGGDVYEVTNLNESGPGSFRAAVQASGPRTVVFRVAGTIEIGTLNITNPCITIAGQTAPGDGITLKGRLNIQASDVIIRYIRVRTEGSGDAISSAKKESYIILDHVSASWSSDEVLSIYHNNYVTIQWCMITEACNFANHGFGGIWGNNHSTYHHNLFAHNVARNPRIASGAGYNDIRNNVIYNWKNESVYGGEVHQVGEPEFNFCSTNVVANYFKPGPGTQPEFKTRICSPWSREGAVDYGKWYIADNYLFGSPEVTADNWKGVFPQYTGKIPVDLGAIPGLKLNAPSDFMPINQQTAEAAYLSVLEHAGCSLPRRDSIDIRIINEVRNGTATFGSNGFINDPKDVGGWPLLKSGTAPADSDHDGMPDAWEKLNGLNLNNANDRNNKNSAGYTMLEVYLNSIDNL